LGAWEVEGGKRNDRNGIEVLGGMAEEREE